MQAWNNRLVGDILFTAAPATDTHYTINVETTAPGGMFKLTPWTMDETQQSGFGVVVSEWPFAIGCTNDTALGQRSPS
jgi:hypothetical protein